MNARQILWLAALATALLVVSCNSEPEPEPSVPAAGNVFRVELSQQRRDMIAVFVHDDAGVVVGVARNDPARNPQGAEDGAIADPDSSSLFVSWVGGACHFGPTVMLSGGTDHLVVTLRPDADEGHAGAPVSDCDAIGLLFSVRLILAAPVGQDAIEYQVVR